MEAQSDGDVRCLGLGIEGGDDLCRGPNQAGGNNTFDVYFFRRCDDDDVVFVQIIERILGKEALLSPCLGSIQTPLIRCSTRQVGVICRWLL